MSSQLHNLHKEIFFEALQKAGGDRAAYLDEVCVGDGGLRRQIEQLLAAHVGAGDFLAEPSAGPGPPEVEGTGAQVGPYRLDRLIGEGGFGKVYLAEQTQPVTRRVAVKILKPGMDSGQVIARFDAERQALALMNHPGIARIIDAGTTWSGRPYVVMEYVDGEPVTAYCDGRALSIDDRLGIFEQICLAVHHAHQKGIIHRDLKPTNVLVATHDGVPAPKVIDFGIAKAMEQPLTDRTLQTAAQQLLGTPQYMSPEQADLGTADLDTRSDIYSLGVLLYELLAGRPPFAAERFRDASLGEIQRIVREEQPPRPRLRGDLDWIVLKAIEKDPGRRYASAAGLAADVRRHLEHEPVEARPPGTAYVLARLARRHRVAAAGLRQASRQRDLAQRALRTSERRLWDSYVAQARAARAGSRPGRRFDSLDALRRAAAIRRSPILRDEAIACLSLPDVRQQRTWSDLPAPSAMGLRRIDRLAFEPGPGRVEVISTADGEVLDALDGPGTITAKRFSPDGRYLAIARGGRLDVRDLTTRSTVVTVRAGFQAVGIAFDPSATPAQWVAVTEQETVQLYRLPLGARSRTLPGAAGTVALAADPAGAAVVIVSYDARTLETRSIEDGAASLAIEPPVELLSVAWSPDGGLLVGGGRDGSVYLWRATDGELIHVLRGHQGAVAQVAFDAQESTLASYGWDNTVRLWSVTRGEPILGPIRGWWLAGFGGELATSAGGRFALWQFEPGREYRRLDPTAAFGSPSRPELAPDASWLMTAGENGVRLWDTATGHPIAVLTERRARGGDVLPGGDGVVASIDGELFRWSLRTGPDGAIRATGAERLADFGDVRNMSLGPDGRTVIVVTHRELLLHDVESNRSVGTLAGYDGMASEPSATPDGAWVFTGTWKGGPARVRDRRGETVLEIASPHVTGRFSPDGRTLAIGTGAEHRLFEVGTWSLKHRLPRDNIDDLAGPVEFTADGTVVFVCHSRYVVRMIDVASGGILASLENPDAVAVRGLSVSADGGRLAATGQQGPAHVWDLDLIRRRLVEAGLQWPPPRPGPGR